ncbi:MAG: hypothetical protein IJE63_01855, partial [Clostridia bacterium]|nr:hypothetical protein [Clostridia bacterium]
MDKTVLKLLLPIVKNIMFCVFCSSCATMFLVLAYFVNSRILFIIAAGFSFATPFLTIVSCLL